MFSKDWEKLDALIDKFERLVKYRDDLDGSLSTRRVDHPEDLICGTIVHDWRPVWDQAKAIQEAFNARPQYPTKSDRERAWLRFNNLRNEASKVANEEREVIFKASCAWRDRIWEKAHSCRYSKALDMLFFFDPTTVEEMKAAGRRLKEAGQLLSEKKDHMQRQHKDECFAKIQEVRKTHDDFWGEYNRARETKRDQAKERM